MLPMVGALIGTVCHEVRKGGEVMSIRNWVNGGAIKSDLQTAVDTVKPVAKKTATGTANGAKVVGRLSLHGAQAAARKAVAAAVAAKNA